MKIRTNIVFEKYDANHDLLERRIQPCKSFIKQLWELMYIQSAQIVDQVPRVGVLDISGQVRALSAVDQWTAIASNSWQDLWMKSTLAVAAPSGQSGIYLPSGNQWSLSSISGRFAQSSLISMLRGETIGICIGADNTVVAPNDHKMISRIFHGQRTAEAVAILMQADNAGDTSDQEVYTTNPKGQIFTVTRGFACSSIKVKIYREGNPGIITMSLLGAANLAASSTSQVGAVPEITTPIATATSDGDTLTNVSPGEWREFTFASPVQLVPGMLYAVTMTNVGGTAAINIHWRSKVIVNSELGFITSSSNSGATWLVDPSGTFMYELWGTAPGEIEYGGCEIHGLVVADPNASFLISRNFYNHSGAAVDIKECGIQGAGTCLNINASNANNGWRADVFSFLIARDVVAPTITLLDGEVLQVTYTPQVTV